MIPALQAALEAVAARDAEIEQRLAALEAAHAPAPPPVEPPVEPPAPEPPPAPPPVEPPSPPPPGSVGMAEIHVEPFADYGRIVCFEGWNSGNYYDREQSPTIWHGTTADVVIKRFSMNQWSAETYRPARTYTLLIDGVPAGSVSMAEGQASGVISVALASVAPGWRRLNLDGLQDGETCPTWFAMHRVDGVALPDVMPIVTGNYDTYTGKPHKWRWAKAEYKPPIVPLVKSKGYAPVPTATLDLKVELLVPGESGNQTFACMRFDGVVSAFNRQSYYYDDLTHITPRGISLMDGPRGVGMSAMATHIDIGVARTSHEMTAPPTNTIYICHPWGVVRVTDDGHMTTLCGFRHKGMPSRDDGQATLELVGNWSEIAPDRRRFHELWGMAWLNHTLATDLSAEPIPAEGNLLPHIQGPSFVVADAQMNAIRRVTFDPRSHATPAKITEFITGLTDPWDVVPWRDSLLVSERALHSITQWSAHTGAFERVVLERNPDLPGSALLSPVEPRHTWIQGTLAEVQAQPVVSPEGLFVIPGDDWLYFGSHIQQQVRKIHLVTGELQVAASPHIDGQSRFLKIAVSDGTFGPRGTVFYQSWTNTFPGSSHMTAILPDGKLWNYATICPWGADGYGCAVAVGGGRMYVSSSHYGLWRYSSGARVDGAKYQAGLAEWDAMHGRMQWGTLGYFGDDKPLPWGKSDALDYFLAVNGHRN